MFDLDLKTALKQVKKGDKVCIQLPDGLKPQAKKIADTLEKEAGVEVLIWSGSCFGACDTPSLKGVDVLIQWGHSEFFRL